MNGFMKKMVFIGMLGAASFAFAQTSGSTGTTGSGSTGSTTPDTSSGSSGK